VTTFAQAGLPFQAVMLGLPTGLVGMVGVRIETLAGVQALQRTIAGIVESPVGSGVYLATIGPLATGSYVILWDTVPGGNPLTPANTFPDSLTVSPTLGASQGVPIAQVQDLKSYLNIDRGDRDDFLNRLLLAVSDRVERYTGHLFRPNPPLANDGTDTLPPATMTVYPLRTAGTSFPDVHNLTVGIPDARSITQITLETAVVNGWTAVGDPPYSAVQVYNLLYRYFQPNYLQLSTLGPRMVVTGRFGWVPPPADITDAVLVMAARRYRERDASYGDTVQTADGGVISYYRQLPATVQATLEQYRSHRI